MDFWVVAYDYPEDPGGYDEELELDEVKAFTKAYDDPEGALFYDCKWLLGNPFLT